MEFKMSKKMIKIIKDAALSPVESYFVMCATGACDEVRCNGCRVRQDRSGDDFTQTYFMDRDVLIEEANTYYDNGELTEPNDGNFQFELFLGNSGDLMLCEDCLRKFTKELEKELVGTAVSKHKEIEAYECYGRKENNAKNFITTDAKIA